MGIISFLKEKLKRFDKSKALPSGNDEKTIATADNQVTIAPKTEKQDPFHKVEIKETYPFKGTVDFAIEQFIAAMQYKYEQGNNVSAYSALISLSSLDNTFEGNNASNQAAFLNNVRSRVYSKNMNESVQSDRNGTPAFYHFYTKPLIKHDSRVYLNCKQENVALLADKLATNLGDSKYYFKFGAAETKSRRSEQFVFYIDDSKDTGEFTRVINCIEKVKKENPELLEGSENVNPFMKTYNGYIAYAPEVKDPNYVGLDGRQKQIDPSYNTLLSEALNESTVDALQKICATKYDLAEKTFGMRIDDISGFLATGAISEILHNPEYLREVIKEVKQDLITLSACNPQLDIKGIPNRQEQMKNKDRRLKDIR